MSDELPPDLLADLEAELARLRDEHRPSGLALLEEVAGAAAAARRGDLDDRRREVARAAAHRLHGTLGTLGFAGSDDAAACERELRGPEPSVAVLEAAVSRLRAALAG